jgi:tetratricopeptide (TPR) repeat protein
LSELSNKSLARVDWIKRLGWDFNQLEDLRFVGYHYIRQGQYNIAKAFFEALVALSADQPLESQLAYDYETLGGIYLQLGDCARALRYLERAHRMQPENGRILLNKAKALIALARPLEGLAIAHELVQRKDPLLRDRAQALILSQELVGVKLPEKQAQEVSGIVNVDRAIEGAFNPGS